MNLYEYSCEVVRVVDGDTYDLRVNCGFKIELTERFRLMGADTPEKYGRRASDEGKAASVFVEDLLGKQDKPLLIKTFKDRKGKYGRYLVDVMINIDENGQLFTYPRSLSEYLVEKGIAKTYKV